MALQRLPRSFFVNFSERLLTPRKRPCTFSMFVSASSLFRPRCFASCGQRGFFTCSLFYRIALPELPFVAWFRKFQGRRASPPRRARAVESSPVDYHRVRCQPLVVSGAKENS